MQRREFIAAVGAAAAGAVSQSSPIYAQPVGGLAVAAPLCQSTLIMGSHRS